MKHIHWNKRENIFILIMFFILLSSTINAEPLTGTVTTTNSIIGTSTNDQVGLGSVIELSSGNVVLINSNWDNGGVTDVGAVTCLTAAEYQAGNVTVNASNSLIGSTASDKVGEGGVIVLSNGNYVVRSQNWGATDVGAVTWVDGSTCFPYGESSRGAVVSISNSLTGTTTSDNIGGNGVTVLTNGNYIVASPNWDNGGMTNIGAVTWVNGMTGIPANENSGGVTVSTNNSLIGERANNSVGNSSIVELSNGNYVVRSPNWDSSTLNDAGAATLVKVAESTTGIVSDTNSLTGALGGNNISSSGVLALTGNGNYVVLSNGFDISGQSNVGAATWVDGTTGIPRNENSSGVQVSSNNSIIGAKASDEVGSSAIALTNGNYVVRSPNWDNGSPYDAGAATWGSGTEGVSGDVNASNSLVGTLIQDNVGSGGIYALSSGNYVVVSPFWDNNNTSGGAVTWGNGHTGITGTINSGNSFVGTNNQDQVGKNGITVLTNGHYVIRSSQWNGNMGAVTWVNGNTGRGVGNSIGGVNSSNSLVGSSTSHQVGSTDITILTNGNYVVRSPNWDNGTTTDVGAATWGDGTNGTAGTVSSTNSIIGGAANNNVGNSNVVALTNGNYVVVSTNWDNGTTTDVGAVTWANGNAVTAAVVSTSNSLYGSTASDNIGSGGITTLVTGDYVVRSPNWDNSGISNVGAVTRGDGATGTTGAVDVSNSWIGSTASDQIGSGGVTGLNNGLFVIISPMWSSTNVGAVTIGAGSGVVSADNSLVGSTTDDQVGSGGILALSDNGYLVRSPVWNNGGTADVGAVSYSVSTLGTVTLTTLAPLTEGETGGYDVSLSIAPTSDVTITMTFGSDIAVEDDADGSVTLTFTPANWSTSQTVDVTAVNDNLVESDHTATITHVVTSADAAYNNINPTPGNQITLNITDNDTATISFESSGASVAEDTAGMFAIDAVLNITGNGNGVEALELGSNINVNLTRSENGASSDEDYSSDMSLSFDKHAPDGTAISISVTVNSDHFDEDAEIVTFGFESSTITGITFSGEYVLTIDDNDTTGVNIVEADGGTSITEGVMSDSYTITLTSKPRGDVTITLAATTLELSPTSVTFTPENWMSPRQVTVTTVNDLLHEESYTEPITHTIDSINDARYDQYTVVDVVVTVNDNDIPGVTISKSTIVMSEGSDAQETYTLVLNVQPLDNVVIMLSATDDLIFTEGGTAVDLTFTNSNWNTPQTVEIAVADDMLFEGNESINIQHTVASSTSYNGIAVNNVTVNITENDTASVTFASGIGTASEGTSPYSVTALLTVSGTGTGQAALGLTEDVTLNIYEFTGTGNATTDYSITTPSITFVKDAATGSTNTIEVTVVDDQIDETDAELFGLAFQLVTGTLTSFNSTHVVTITDNDSNDLVISQTDGSTFVVEGGTSDSYTVVLNSQPTADVTVHITGSQIEFQPTSLNFDGTNWNIPQTVTVSEAEDTVVENIQIATITHNATSDDSRYNGIVSTVNVVVVDNDTTGVTVSKSSVNVTEGGASDSYTIVLNSQPTSDVTIQLSSNQVSFASASLLFTPSNWNIAQTVTVTALDDIEIEGQHSDVITHSAISSDSGYNGVEINSVDVMVTDNDQATTITELLTNPGFEDHNNKPSQPDIWTGKLLSKDKLKCNTDTSIIARNGSCAFRFVGSASEASQLSQPLTNISGLTAETTVHASVYYRTNNSVPKVKVKLKVYYSGVAQPDVTSGTINNVSSTEYTQFNLSSYIIKSGTTVSRIKFLFQNKATSGKIYLDDASVNH